MKKKLSVPKSHKSSDDVSGKESSASKFDRYSNNALVAAIIAGFFGTILGSFLTYFYTIKLKEIDYNNADKLARLESISAELNRIRMHKLGDIWEQIDENEGTLDALFDSASKRPGLDNAQIAQIRGIIKKDRMLINRNRFWLREGMYNQLLDYMAIDDELFLGSFLGHPGIDLSEPRKKRNEARQHIIETRNIYVNDEQGFLIGPPPANK